VLTVFHSHAAAFQVFARGLLQDDTSTGNHTIGSQREPRALSYNLTCLKLNTPEAEFISRASGAVASWRSVVADVCKVQTETTLTT
jgi:hypothetical protein